MTIQSIYDWFLALFSKPKAEPSSYLFEAMRDIENFCHSSSKQANAVFYVGCKDDKPLTTIITQNFKGFFDIFHASGYQFVFYPDFEREKIKVLEKMLPALSYKTPQLHGQESDIIKFISGSDSLLFYESIRKTYQLEMIRVPFFVSVPEKTSGLKMKSFCIKMDEPISGQLGSAVAHFQNVEYDNTENKDLLPEFSLYDEDHAKSKPVRRRQRYNAEDAFQWESSKVSLEVKGHIQRLFQTGQHDALLDIFNTLLQGSKDHASELYDKFRVTGESQVSTALSRLSIDLHYRIWLPDYNNMEIVMTPLPKTLYILFLRHPEGIKLHDLVDHKRELLEIYSRITNSSSAREIKRRIEELTDMRKNSINEKCSRIKGAFVIKMHDPVARHYYITGERKEEKRILLAKDLVEIQGW